MATAKKTYYLNADKSKALPARSVKDGEDDSPEGAAYLLARAGGPISDEDVKKYGVAVETGDDGAPASEQNIVVSGTADSGPAIVETDRLLDEEETPTRKGAKKGK